MNMHKNKINNFFRILEADKSRFVKKMVNLNDEEKSRLINALKASSNLDTKLSRAFGDWQKSSNWPKVPVMQYVLEVEKTLRDNELKRKKNGGIEGLTEGQDYTIVYAENGITVYHILTYAASCVIASNNVKPPIHIEVPDWAQNKDNEWWESRDKNGLSDGAHWCISMRKTSEHWNDYTERKKLDFYFICSENETIEKFKKIAMYITPDFRTHYYPANDEMNLKLEDIPNNIRTAITESGIEPSDGMNFYLKRGIFVKNEDGTYDKVKDVKVDLHKMVEVTKLSSNLMDAVWNLKYKFRKWEGNLSLYVDDVHISSLKNCPEIVTGEFACGGWKRLKSLEGAPREVGSFFCDGADLSANGLKGMPSIVHGSITVSNCNLTSLEGCPEIVYDSFDCSQNPLESLKGCPKKMLRNNETHYRNRFICSNTKIKNLVGAPEIIEGGIEISKCIELTSLIGLPEVVSEDIVLYTCDISSLKGISKKAKSLIITNCFNLMSIDGLENGNYEYITIKNCGNGFSVDDIPESTKYKTIEVDKKSDKLFKRNLDILKDYVYNVPKGDEKSLIEAINSFINTMCKDGEYSVYDKPYKKDNNGIAFCISNRSNNDVFNAKVLIKSQKILAVQKYYW